MLDTLLYDLRHALRGIRRSPGFALAVVLTLGLAIGANAALFSVIDVLLFRPPAGVADPGRVRRLTFRSPSKAANRFGISLSYLDFRDLRAHTPAFSSLAAQTAGTVTYGVGLQAEELKALFASMNYFTTLGVRPVVGSFFPPVDDRQAEQVVVLGFDLWQRAFGGERTVVGRTIRLDTRDYRILGVAPRGFRGIDLDRVDVFLPLTAMPFLVYRPQGLESRGTELIQVVGRLTPGTSPAVAAARATAALSAVKAGNPDFAADRATGGWRVGLATLNDHFAAGTRGANPVPAWLLGVTAALLLIACINVANLLLARGIRRRRELAIRVAVGAGWLQLTRQLLVEAAVLATFSTGLALVIAAYSRALLALLPLPELPSLFGGRVFVFTLAVAAVALAAAGILPALRSTGVDVEAVLKGVSGRTTSAGALLRRGIMAGQLALSLVLLVAAGLFLRSLANIRSVDLGYDMDHTLAIRADLGVAGYTSAAWNSFQSSALERLPHVPGVRSVALATMVPSRSMAFTEIEAETGDWRVLSLAASTTPGLFRTMGIRFLDGRDFTDADNGANVAIVNRSMARRYWPGLDPIGRCFRENRGACLRIVGVVGDVMLRGMSSGFEPMYFRPLPRENWKYAHILVQVNGDPARLVPAIRRELAAIDPFLPLVKLEPLAQHRAAEFAPWRMAALVTAAGAVLALLLAIIGLYGVIAFLTEQRRREIGIRTALGADPRRIARLVLGEGMRVALGGCLLGVLAAVALVRLVRGRLYGVSPTDPATYVVVVAVLAAAALLACYIPARRAARVDPLEALRAE